MAAGAPETRPALTTARLFLQITGSALASGILVAGATQALSGALLAAFGVASAAGNGRAAHPLALLGGILFLALVGAIAGGLLAIPSGLFVGLSGGLLMSLLTRLFFFPPTRIRVYRVVVPALMALYTIGATWCCVMAVYLLFSRDHRVHSPAVPWVALLQAALAGALGYVVFGWIARSYLATALPAQPTVRAEDDAAAAGVS